MANDAQLEMVVKLVDEATANLKSIKNEISGLTDTTKTATTQTSTMANTLKAGLLALGSSAVIGAIKGIAGSIIETAASFEQTKIAFTGMLGSGEAAITLLQQLSDFAAKTPFEISTVEEAAKKLMAYGVEVEDLLPTLKDLGDISSIVGTEKLPNLILALGQVKAKTVLSGEELRQFTETGIPLIEELSKVTGIAVTEIVTDTKDLGITYDQVRQALGNMTTEGGIAYNAMGLQVETFNGKISNFKDNITRLQRAFTPLLDVLKPLIDRINEFLNTITERIEEVGFKQWVEENKTALTILAGVLGGVLLGAIIGLTVALWALLGPVIIIGGALGVLGGLAAFFVKNIIEGWPAVVALWNMLKTKAIEIKNSVVEAFTDLVSGIVDKAIELKDSVIEKVVEIKDGAIEIWNAFVGLLTNLWNGLVEIASTVWQGLVTAATGVWNAIVTVFKFWVAFVVGLVIVTFEAMGIDIVAVFTSIRDWLVAFWDGLKTMISEKVNAIIDGIKLGLQLLFEFWLFIWQGISDFVTFLWEEMTAWIGGQMDAVSTKVTDGMNTVNSVWQSVWGAIVNYVKARWEDIKNGFKAFIEAFMTILDPWIETLSAAWQGMWDSFKNMATEAWETVKEIVKSGINWVIEKVNALIEAINTVASKGAGVLGFKNVPQIPSIPLLAKGGVVNAAGAAIVGEAGPELVSLPRGAVVSPLGGGATVVININNATVLSDEDIVERIGDPIIRVLKQHAAIA